MVRAYDLISADSHILEPPHLWKQYMPRKFHEKAPRVVPDGEGGEAWQFSPDAPPAPIGIYASAGRKHADVRWTGVTFAEANQGNFRAEPRLAEQDLDGVDAEVLFGSARMMSHFFSDPDPEFQLAGVQAYNNWIAEEFVKVAPERLIGLACMPALGVEESIREMERCLRLGMRGVWLNTMPSVGSSIRPEDDKFWDAAQALGVPVHFHVRGLHDRPLRGDEPARDRRREHALVDRLPAPRLRLAGDAPRGRRRLPRRAGGRAPADVRRQRGGALPAGLASRLRDHRGVG